MIVWQLRGVNVHIVVPVDSFNDFPLNLVFWFLPQQTDTQINSQSWDEYNICLTGGCSPRMYITAPSYLHVLVEQQDNNEAEDACCWYEAN